MQIQRHVLGVVIGVVLAGGVLRAQAQTAASLNELIGKRDAAVRQLQSGMAAQKADLFDKYAAALDTVLQQFTAKGDLDGVLVLKEEIESARKNRAVSVGMLPVIESYRTTLRKSLTLIEDNATKSQTQIDADYVMSLNQMQMAFAKAGLLDEATAAMQEVLNVSAGTVPHLVLPLSPLPAKPAAAPAKPNPSAAELTPAGQVPELEKPIVGEVNLRPGSYRMKNRVDVGAPAKDKSTETVGKLLLGTGTKFEQTTIFLRKGLLSADQALFKDCRLQSDLAGTFQAKNSLFHGCLFQKGGAWFVDLYSSKWVLENCALSSSFFIGWTTGNVGLKVTRCTFHEVTFAPVTYKRDAGKEAAHPWFTVRQCKFIGCTIPESFFLATEDCVFEHCRFEAAKEKENMPLITPHKVRAYVTEPSAVPPAPETCTYELLDPKTAPKEIGADLNYQRLGRTALRFP